MCVVHVKSESMLIESRTSQLPGNLALRKVGVRNWLTFIVIAWGSVQLGMAFVNDWRWLFLCRFLLGTFEARSPFPISKFPALSVDLSGFIPTIGSFHYDDLVCRG
jgi:hypothetical protein